jgi:hypothetical protein
MGVFVTEGTKKHILNHREIQNEDAIPSVQMMAQL